jgi:hypothetical protein
MNTVTLPRAAVSILKVIDEPTSQSAALQLHYFQPSTHQGQCKPNTLWISLKTVLEAEIGVTES